MELLVSSLGESIEKHGVIDEIKSLIWTRKYFSTGAFDLVAPANEKNLSLIKKHRIISFAGSSDSGFIENINISTDDEGAFITASGCFLLGVLGRRCAVSNCKNVADLIAQNAITCTNAARNIPLLTLSKDLENVVFDSEVAHEKITDVLEALSKRDNISFGIRVNPAAKSLEFYSCRGLDRSFSQSKNPRAVFSKEYENLTAIEYTNSDAGAVNSVVGVCKIPPGTIFSSVPSYEINDGNGLERQEIFIETEAVTYDREVQIPFDGGYETVIKTYLNEAATLANMKADCEAALVKVAENVEATSLFKSGYRERFDLGDIVEIRDERFGISLTKRVFEVTENYDNTANDVIPLFGSPAATIMDLLKKKK